MDLIFLLSVLSIRLLTGSYFALQTNTDKLKKNVGVILGLVGILTVILNYDL